MKPESVMSIIGNERHGVCVSISKIKYPYNDIIRLIEQALFKKRKYAHDGNQINRHLLMIPQLNNK